MATLQGRAIKDTFKDLLQVSNGNNGVDGTIRSVEDGEGTTSALAVSSSAVRINGDLDVTGDVTGVPHVDYKGNYSASTSYIKDDVVVFNGSSYIAKGNTTGNAPTNTTYWGLLAQKGSDGSDGANGSNGNDGATGPAGPAGPAGADGQDFSGYSYLTEKTLNLLNTGSTGNAYIEVGSPNATYIDLKQPSSDDYDLRIIHQGTGDVLDVHNSRTRLEGGVNVGICAGADAANSVPAQELVTVMYPKNITTGLKSQADGSGGFTAQWTDGANGSSVRIGGDASNYSTNVIDATTINFPTSEIEWNPHFMVRGDARFLRNGAENMPLAVFEGTEGDAEVALVLANSETGSSKGTVMIHTCESFDHEGSAWFNFGNQSHLGKATWAYVLANAQGDAHGVEVNQTDGAFTPLPDNKTNLGTSSTRWKQLFAGTTTISTSDVNLKTSIEDLTEAEKRVAVACKGLIKKFKFKDAVAEKGDNARYHIGVIAQEIEQAFIAEGLDGWDYGILCKDDSWHGVTKPTSAYPKGQQLNLDHEPTTKDQEAVNADGFTKSTKYSVRYEELLAFVVSAI